LLGRENYVIQIEITACAAQVLHLKALHVDTLYQLLTIGIECIQRIDGIVLGLVCRRVVKYKQWIESLDTRLCGITLHLLRLVHNDNRMIGGNHINRSATAKFIALGVDDTALLALATLLHKGGKGLSIDNHYAQSRIGRETIELLQIAAIIDKPTSLFAIVLHKMLFQHIKTLGYALTNGNTWYYDDKFTPTILLVQFKHCLNIDVCLTCTCLHLNIEVYRTYTFGKCSRRSYII